MDNTSGRGAQSQVPAELDRWNWGAFLLSWIWGIAHNTWIALLMFVPMLNLAMPFVLGARGSAWAWQNKRWDSIEAFRSEQRRWARWGVIAWIAGVVLLAGFAAAITLLVGLSLKHSDAYQLGVNTLQAQPAIVRELGEPIAAGWPSGSLNIAGDDGHATLSFAVHGSRSSGTVHVVLSRHLGRWRLDQGEFEPDDGGAPVAFGE